MKKHPLLPAYLNFTNIEDNNLQILLNNFEEALFNNLTE